MVRRRALDPTPLLDESCLMDIMTQEYDLTRDNARLQCGLIWKRVFRRSLGNNETNIEYLDLASIHNLPKKLVEPLKTRFALVTSKVIRTEVSQEDGTVKLLIQLQDGHQVESVIINHTTFITDNHEISQDEERGLKKSVLKRATLCVSSQVGCRMGCSFCATGTMGLSGNLFAGEILEQMWHARQIQPEISNVVFMGMGEPLENYDNVLQAIRGLTDQQRFGLSPKGVTVSTVGLIPAIERLITDAPNVRLALSLHAPNQAIRAQIVPTATAWPIDKLVAAINGYSSAQMQLPGGKNRGFVMIEYVVLKGINDGREHAHELARLLKDSRVVVNFIPYNKFEGNPFNYEEPCPTAVQDMIDILSRRYGVRVYERRHHGRDISAACGQLAKISKGAKESDMEGVGDVKKDLEGAAVLPPRSEPEVTCEVLSGLGSIVSDISLLYLSDPHTRSILLWTGSVIAGAALSGLWKVWRR